MLLVIPTQVGVGVGVNPGVTVGVGVNGCTIKLALLQLGTWDAPEIFNPELLTNVRVYGELRLTLYIWPRKLPT